jgi:DnaJ-class molecular chaperone
MIIDRICSNCSGSGEGMYEGTKCYVCGGKGEVQEESEELSVSLWGLLVSSPQDGGSVRTQSECDDHSENHGPSNGIEPRGYHGIDSAGRMGTAGDIEP